MIIVAVGNWVEADLNDPVVEFTFSTGGLPWNYYPTGAVVSCALTHVRASAIDAIFKVYIKEIQLANAYTGAAVQPLQWNADNGPNVYGPDKDNNVLSVTFALAVYRGFAYACGTVYVPGA